MSGARRFGVRGAVDALRGPRRLRTRLALATSAAAALVVVGVCAAAFFVLRYKLYQQLDQNLTQSATLVAHQMQESRTASPGTLRAECRYLGAPACAQIVPRDPAHDPADRYALPVYPATRAVAAGRQAPYYRDITVAGHPARMLTTTFGGGTAVQVALRSDIAERGVRQTAWLMVTISMTGVVVAGALGHAVSRAGLAPIARLTATAERVAATRDPRHRIDTPFAHRHRDDELTRLATTFNTMLDALDRSVTAQRRLIADASHELRTPLTALRTNSELLARADRLTAEQRERAASALGRQVHDVTGLVNDLIELARDEEPQPLVEQVNIAGLVRDAVAVASERWPEVTFRVEVTERGADRLHPGIPARLSRLLGNLLDNAAKFSSPGDPVDVTVTERDVTVRDHGPGIAPEDLPHIFDRFYRAPSARPLPGSGLGLAMARQIALTHAADLAAERPPDGGALFRLTFPP
ncbi:HAMP domain-containing sensor histidine kinase [Streptomyces sp. NPDC046197]|uniref:HAMP domain-containing sensor histidine kinase n=1 Tax=Streptomyces sp. NPDC046197 TaxID=3154337 RepID=UPI0033F3CA20